MLYQFHLGTFGCQAKELLFYLQSVKPQILIFLNRRHC